MSQARKTKRPPVVAEVKRTKRTHAAKAPSAVVVGKRNVDGKVR